MIRKIIAFLIIIALVLSVGVTRVYATEEGTIVGNENGYIQDEDGNDIAVNPDNESDNDQNNQGPAEYVEQETLPSKDEFYANGDYNVGNEANNGTTSGPVINDDDMIVDENQIGFLAIKLEVSEDFYQNVLVELYNRKTAQIVQIPVYAANNWTENVEVPVGKYMVYNVQAGGDDILNPDWLFEHGAKVDIEPEAKSDLTIKLLKGPNFNAEPEVTDPAPTVPDDEITDTEMQPEDIGKNPVPEKKPLGKQIGDFLLSLVTGGNLIILIVLAGASIGYLYLKKKREDG